MASVRELASRPGCPRPPLAPSLGPVASRRAPAPSLGPTASRRALAPHLSPSVLPPGAFPSVGRVSALFGRVSIGEAARSAVPGARRGGGELWGRVRALQGRSDSASFEGSGDGGSEGDVRRGDAAEGREGAGRGDGEGVETPVLAGSGEAAPTGGASSSQSSSSSSSSSPSPSSASSSSPSCSRASPPAQPLLSSLLPVRPVLGRDRCNVTWYPRLRDACISRARVVLLDAEGQVLGRLASVAAAHLRGKAGGPFAPSADQGARVVVVNAARVHVTGRKEDQKTYFRNATQRPGHGKIEPLRLLRARAPERILQRAIWGMLPKGRLGRRLFTKLRVFAGNEFRIDEWGIGTTTADVQHPTALSGAQRATADDGSHPADARLDGDQARGAGLLAQPSTTPVRVAPVSRASSRGASPSSRPPRPPPEVLDATWQVSTSAGPHRRPPGTDPHLPAADRREALWRETARRLQEAERKLTLGAWERDGEGWEGGVPGVLRRTRGRGEGRRVRGDKGRGKGGTNVRGTSGVAE